jgi:hypothetical protein
MDTFNIIVEDYKIIQPESVLFGYVLYVVQSSIGGGTCVSRRYKDFEWLRAELANEHKGCIIPPLPPKVNFSNLKAHVIESRARAFTSFLRKVSSHRQLGPSGVFKSFLKLDEEALLAAQTVVAPSTSMSTLVSTTMTTAISTKPHLPDSESDTKTREIAGYVIGLQKQLKVVLSNVDKFIDANTDAAEGDLDYAISVRSLGDKERRENAGLGELLESMGTAVVKVNSEAVTNLLQMKIKFLEPIDECSRYLDSIRYAIKQHDKAKDAYS